mgnify:CR=1 FL=1
MPENMQPTTSLEAIIVAMFMMVYLKSAETYAIFEVDTISVWTRRNIK